MISKLDSKSANRRKFLLAAGATAATATVAAPAVQAQSGPINFRFQSTWPSKDIFHEYALDFGKKVNDMTGGDLKIEVLPAGAVVPAFQLLDAVSKGVLDGGHGVLVYHYGKNTALALWGSGPAYAMDANMLLSWHKYGGGKALLEKIFAQIGANVVSFPYAPLYTQPLGWFKKPVQSVDDFKGLKYRTVGISIDLFTALGAAVNALPGGEIVAAMDRGLLDAAEFNNASSDRALGFADVSKICMLQSYHQNSEQLEISFNKDKLRGLPPKLQAIIENAVEAASQDMQWKAIDRNSQGLHHAADHRQGEVLQDPRCHPEAAVGALRRDRQEIRGQQPAVQGDPRVATRLRQARDTLGAGLRRQPQDGVRPLLGTERQSAGLTAH